MNGGWSWVSCGDPCVCELKDFYLVIRTQSSCGDTKVKKSKHLSALSANTTETLGHLPELLHIATHVEKAERPPPCQISNIVYLLSFPKDRSHNDATTDLGTESEYERFGSHCISEPLLRLLWWYMPVIPTLGKLRQVIFLSTGQAPDWPNQQLVMNWRGPHRTPFLLAELLTTARIWVSGVMFPLLKPASSKGCKLQARGCTDDPD